MSRPKARKTREAFGMVDKLSSGRIRARYTGPDGIRYSAPRTFDTLTDARSWLARQRVAIESGKWAAHEAAAAEGARTGRTGTLGEFATQWLAERGGRKGNALTPRTREEYLRLLNGPLADLTGLRLVAISPDAVRSWYAAQRQGGKLTQAARAYSLLKSILATAVIDGRIPSNPCQIRGAANASTGRKVEPPTDAELQEILDTIAKRYRAMILLAAWSGARYGELTELRRNDIRITRNASGAVTAMHVNIARAVTHVTGQGFIPGDPKSDAGFRSIALPPHIFDDVLTHLAEYVDHSPDALLFPARSGGYLSESSFTKVWYRARAKAGRSDMPFHALRHYGATRFALTGATLGEIQARLGHADPRVAMRYQHTANRDEELARRMSELA